MSESPTAAAPAPLTGRTAWARSLQTPLREFLRTETGSAAVLLAAAVVALVWANVDIASYERVWSTDLTVRLGHWSISQDLRHWINGGLMTFFFFVVGLEARRELDLGELRERRRFVLPVLAGLAGVVVPVALYLAFNAGRPSAHGWGVAMSTDTAFALGMLALVGPRFPDRLRAFMLTVVVTDDLAGLVVIATAYTSHLHMRAFFVALAFFAVVYAIHRARIRRGLVYLTLGIGAWIALYESGIDPVRLRAASSSVRPTSSAASASSRRGSSPARHRPAWPGRSLRTSASSSSTTRGRATSSCRSSRSPTRGSRSTARSSPVRSARR